MALFGQSPLSFALCKVRATEVIWLFRPACRQEWDMELRWIRAWLTLLCTLQGFPVTSSYGVAGGKRNAFKVFLGIISRNDSKK